MTCYNLMEDWATLKNISMTELLLTLKESNDFSSFYHNCSQRFGFNKKNYSDLLDFYFYICWEQKARSLTEQDYVLILNEPKIFKSIISNHFNEFVLSNEDFPLHQLDKVKNILSGFNNSKELIKPLKSKIKQSKEVENILICQFFWK